MAANGSDSASSRPEDLWGALAAFVIAALVFYRHMAPEVMLDGAGILVTGAYQFGIPHPTGHPLWMLFGYVWSHAIVPFGNPAWRIGTMSVFTSGLLVGLLAFVMIRSTRLLLQALPTARADDETLQRWLATAVGFSTALLFGFSRGVWYWACVPEQWAQNTFVFVLLAWSFLLWVVRPERRRLLYSTLFLFGASAADHQTVVVMVGALLVGLFVAGVDRLRRARVVAPADAQPGAAGRFVASLSDLWDVMSAALLCSSMGFLVTACLRAPDASLMKATMQADLWLAFGCFAAGGGVLVMARVVARTGIARALACTGSLLAGFSCLLLLPLAASTNPPINWGYAGTREGFLHLIARGQYERLQFANPLDPVFRIQTKMFLVEMAYQYGWSLCVFGGVAACAAVWLVCRRPRMSHGKALTWLSFVWAAFLASSLGLIVILNPRLDHQEREIMARFFVPAHGFAAMLIGYGMAVTGWIALRKWKIVSSALIKICCAALLALPLITYCANRTACALETCDFGYQFGYRMFHPGGGYPDMEKDAVLFGGTDPGRFVPTYMIFCESRAQPHDRFRNQDFDRSDVYILTQNALADNTYMSVIRDQYGLSRPTNNATMLQRALGRDRVYPKDPIRIPTLDDSTRAFQQFVEDWKAGKAPPGADVKIEGGRVQVTGVQSVMAINGILAQWIFDWNKDQHAFYVEESYVIPWMYPYLRPSGVIMKIEKEPLASPQQDRKLWDGIIAEDKAYWDRLTADLTSREEFLRNNDAKRSFSKMRSAIAGLYLWRGMLPEAESAFRQSLQLCPESPEGCFRLADLCMNQRRFADARRLMENYLVIDEYNHNVRGFLNQIDNLEKCDKRRGELQKKMEGGAADINDVMELITVFSRMNMQGEVTQLGTSLLNNTNVPPKCLLDLAQRFGESHRTELAQEAFRRYLVHMPEDWRAWIELGWTHMLQNHTSETLAAWRKAVDIGGDAARLALRKDPRFQSLWEQHELPPQFRELLHSP